MRFERVLDQLRLHFLAGVAVLRLDDLDARCPSTAPRKPVLPASTQPAPAGPGNQAALTGVRAGRMQPGEELAGLGAHLAERHQRLRRKLRRGDAVDHVDDRNVLRADFGDEVVQAVEGDGADDDGVGAGGDAVLDLRDLLRQLGVAAGLDELHLDALPLRLLGDAVVDAEPVGVLHVREGDADLPGLRRLLERHVILRRARARHVERRIPDLDLIGKPVGRRCRRHRDQQAGRQRGRL